MNSRERWLALLENRPVDHLALMPITMMFAAAQRGVLYGDYVTDHRVLVEAQTHVAEKFGFDYVSCISDPAREAADLGADVHFFEDQPPAINEENARLKDKTALASLQEAAAGAAAILCIGTCASFGGIQAISPNPTGAVGVRELVKDKPIVNISGCPPNPYNFLSTILYYLTFKRLPELDNLGRPKFAYGRKIHEHCERRPHFDAGRFAQAYGDAGHAAGYCLYKLGCKGPATYANCSVQRFNDIGVWPVSMGHPCIGCTEPDILFKLPIDAKVQIHDPTPFDSYAPAHLKEKGKGPHPVTTGLVGLAAGTALGAAALFAKKLPAQVEPHKADSHEADSA